MSRLLVAALLGEALLASVALVWIWSRGLAVESGPLIPGLVFGIATAGALAVVNYALLWWAPSIGPVRSIRRLYVEMLRPLFAAATPVEVVGVSLAAGLGEELLFRGAVQTEMGLAAASVLFGVAHVGGRASIVFGVWVTLMGTVLGKLVDVTNGLLAPIVAHAVYDALAISYIRWDARREEQRSRG